MRLVSSQFCRALETTRLTSSTRSPSYRRSIRCFYLTKRDERDSRKVRQVHEDHSGNQLTVLVTHISNIQSIAGMILDSGEMAVVHLDASGAVAVDGRIKVLSCCGVTNQCALIIFWPPSPLLPVSLSRRQPLRRAGAWSMSITGRTIWIPK